MYLHLLLYSTLPHIIHVYYIIVFNFLKYLIFKTNYIISCQRRIIILTYVRTYVERESNELRWNAPFLYAPKSGKSSKKNVCFGSWIFTDPSINFLTMNCASLLFLFQRWFCVMMKKMNHIRSKWNIQKFKTWGRYSRFCYKLVWIGTNVDNVWKKIESVHNFVRTFSLDFLIGYFLRNWLI